MTNDKTKISSNRQKKEKMVEELESKVNKAKTMVLTNYQGLKHQQLEELKKALRPIDAEIVVTKNTLLKIALNKTKKIEAPEEAFNNPTATLFAYADILSPLKELTKMIKNLKLPEIKLGILDGKVITAQDVTKLATLPSREVLIAQVIGGMKSPIFGLHRALNWNIQKLVLTLGAIQKSKS